MARFEIFHCVPEWGTNVDRSGAFRSSVSQFTGPFCSSGGPLMAALPRAPSCRLRGAGRRCRVIAIPVIVSVASHRTKQRPIAGLMGGVAAVATSPVDLASRYRQARAWFRNDFQNCTTWSVARGNLRLCPRLFNAPFRWRHRCGCLGGKPSRPDRRKSSDGRRSSCRHERHSRF